VHHDGRHKTGGHVNRILNPEDRHVQNQVPYGAAADAGNDGEPHEPHHVHAFTRRDERAGHGEHDCRKDVEEVDETKEVRGIDQCGLHTHRADGAEPLQYATVALLSSSGGPSLANTPLFVVPIDFAPEMEATVSAAFALAKKRGAHVHLLEVVTPRAPSLLDGTSGARLGNRITSKRDWSRLEDSMHAAERNRIPVRIVVYRGDAITTITSYVQLTKARLLVIGQHYGTSRWRRSARIVSTLSRAAPAPVLVLPPQRRAEKNQSLSFGHIVSAVDFTVASAVAVRTVVDLIRRTGARLTLVHALKNVSHDMVFSGGEALRLRKQVRGQAAQVAEHFRRKIPANVGIRVQARVTTGAPHRGILDIASEVKADLIVMGVPPRSRLDEVLFGSTLRSVLRRAKIPVLVLPVLAGAYKWLGEGDGVEVAMPSRTPARAKRLPGR
jgi:nucleotide-binding universal stress UspA family protein